jgi:hypothetical protein
MTTLDAQTIKQLVSAAVETAIEGVMRAQASAPPPAPEPPVSQGSKRPLQPPVAHNVSDLIRQGPFGRSTVWSLVHSGALPVRKMGRRTFVLHRDWEALLERCPAGPNRAQVAPLTRRDERGRQAASAAD